MRRAAMELEKEDDTDVLSKMDFSKLPTRGEYYVIIREVLKQHGIDMSLVDVANFLGGKLKPAVWMDGKYVRAVLVKKQT